MPMKGFEPPDGITRAACRWLGAGAPRGGYEGPEPGGGHNLFPLLSMEFGKREAFLLSSAQWFRQEQILGPLLKMLSDEGEALWAFKGFDLARSVYPFPEGRPMGDADLYVEAGNLRGC